MFDAIGKKSAYISMYKQTSMNCQTLLWRGEDKCGGNAKEKALLEKSLFCCIAATGSFRVVWRKQHETRSVLEPDSKTDGTEVDMTPPACDSVKPTM